MLAAYIARRVTRGTIFAIVAELGALVGTIPVPSFAARETPLRYMCKGLVSMPRDTVHAFALAGVSARQEGPTDCWAAEVRACNVQMAGYADRMLAALNDPTHFSMAFYHRRLLRLVAGGRAGMPTPKLNVLNLGSTSRFTRFATVSRT